MQKDQQKLAELIRGKKVAFIGAGVSHKTLIKEFVELGAHVTVEAITPWRFDVARNRSLDLVPADADLCVCTDLDEVFQPGWREKVEEAWTQGWTGCSTATPGTSSPTAGRGWSTGTTRCTAGGAAGG